MDPNSAIVAVAAIAVIGVVGLTVVRTVAKMIDRRHQAPIASPDTLTRISERLDRMEQAIDAVAVEVERVSEAQRFTTRLLSDRTEQGHRLQ